MIWLTNIQLSNIYTSKFKSADGGMMKHAYANIVMVQFVLLFVLIPAGALYAQLQLDWDLVIVSVQGCQIQMRLDVVNNTGEAWSYMFGSAVIALFSIDGQMNPVVYPPVVTPYTLGPGESDSFTMMNYFNLNSGPHLVQAYLNIWQGNGYLAVGEPETVVIEESVPVIAGDGNQPARVPIDFWWRTSLYQCLYAPAEFGLQPGYITAISFYNNFGNNPTDSFLAQQIKLFFSSTTLNDLEGGWVDGFSQFLQFNGEMDFPAGQNEIRFELQMPVYYNGNDNLLLTVYRPIHSSYQFTADPFLADICPSNRALRYYSDSITINPYLPPTLQPSHCFDRLPMTTFYIIPCGDTGVNNDSSLPEIPLTIKVNPNPFTSSCSFLLKNSLLTPDKLKLYDVKGRLVREIIPNATGDYRWDGKTAAGLSCPSGIYIYKAISRNKIACGKVIKL